MIFIPSYVGKTVTVVLPNGSYQSKRVVADSADKLPKRMIRLSNGTYTEATNIIEVKHV